MYYVYVIRNEIDEFYIGYTADLKKRLAEHNAGGTQSTKNHQWELVYYEAYVNERYAHNRERTLKRNRRMNKFLMDRVKESLSY